MRRRQPTHPPEQCQQTVTAGAWSNLGEDLFLYIDSCNVYLLRTGDHAVIGAGTGAWTAHLDELGVRHIDAVVLTHADRDQCCAFYRDDVATALASTRLVSPAGDAPMLQPSHVTRF